jgi:hypothetical protein
VSIQAQDPPTRAHSRTARQNHHMPPRLQARALWAFPALDPRRDLIQIIGPSGFLFYTEAVSLTYPAQRQTTGGTMSATPVPQGTEAPRAEPEPSRGRCTPRSSKRVETCFDKSRFDPTITWQGRRKRHRLPAPCEGHHQHRSTTEKPRPLRDRGFRY